MSEIAEAWLRDEATRLSPRTLVRYGEALDQLLAWLDLTGRPADVTALSRGTLGAWRAWLVEAPGRHGRARRPVTADKAVQAVELMWRWAEDAERWPDVPRARRLRRVRATRPPVVAPTWAQVDAMLAELLSTARRYQGRAPAGAAPQWVVRLVLLARYTGGRREELCLARWDRLDLATATLSIPAVDTKAAAGGRVVPVVAPLAALLRAWRAEDEAAGRAGDTIVGAPEAELSGRGHADRLVRRAWRRAGVPAELWHGRPMHALRRAVRTHLVAAGIQADVIDAALGHAGRGSGGRHYTDRGALLPAVRQALETLPTWVPPMEGE